MSNFIVQALRNEPITIYGEGQQTRSFCYVDDPITAFLALMATPPEFTGPVNLGNPNEFGIAELAEKVVALTGSKSKIHYLPLPSDDPVRRQPDISLARGASQRRSGRREPLLDILTSENIGAIFRSKFGA